MPMEFRRVVTGLDDDGRAVVISDAPTPHLLERPNRPGVRMHNMWRTEQMPALIDGPSETIEGPFVLHPPAGGTILRVIEFHPEDPAVVKNLDGPGAFAEMGAAHNVVESARHPFMHATDTVDYAIILSGEITMLMDEEDVHPQGRRRSHPTGNQPCLVEPRHRALRNRLCACRRQLVDDPLIEPTPIPPQIGNPMARRRRPKMTNPEQPLYQPAPTAVAAGFTDSSISRRRRRRRSLPPSAGRRSANRSRCPRES